MSSLNKRKTRYMKDELENYYFVIRMASTKLIKIVNLEKQQKQDGIDRSEEITKEDNEISMLIARTNKVDTFKNKLSKKDRVIIYHLHQAPTERKSYEVYCHELGMSRSTLQRHVDRLILKHWET